MGDTPTMANPAAKNKVNQIFAFNLYYIKNRHRKPLIKAPVYLSNSERL